MQVVNQLRYFIKRVDQAVGEMVRMAGGETNAFDAVNMRHGLQQGGEVGDL